MSTRVHNKYNCLLSVVVVFHTNITQNRISQYLHEQFFAAISIASTTVTATATATYCVQCARSRCACVLALDRFSSLSSARCCVFDVSLVRQPGSYTYVYDVVYVYSHSCTTNDHVQKKCRLTRTRTQHTTHMERHRRTQFASHGAICVR